MRANTDASLISAGAQKICPSASACASIRIPDRGRGCSFENVRRPSPEYAMLLGAVLLWALNVTVTKYMFEHGWLPLAYGTIRYFCAISLFWVFTLRREGSLRIARADWKYVGIAAAMI